MIDNAAEALELETKEFVRRKTVLRSSSTSLETELAKRRVAVIASHRGLTIPDRSSQYLNPPSDYEENELEEFVDTWTAELNDFSDALLSSMRPGTSTAASSTERPFLVNPVPFMDLDAHLALLDVAPAKADVARPNIDEDEPSTMLDDVFDPVVPTEDEMNDDEHDAFLEGIAPNTEVVQLAKGITKSSLRKFNALATKVHCHPPPLPAGFFDDFVTEPREWQRLGARTIKEMLRSPLKAAILGDGMGLGKTFTAISLGMQDKNEPYQGATLVVVQKALVSTWIDEKKYHLKDGKQPRVLLVDDKKLTTAEMLSQPWDFILTTYHFLCGRAQDLSFAEEHGELITSAGASWLVDQMGIAQTKYHQPMTTNNPFDNEACRLFGHQWRLVILDEGQMVKNPAGEFHLAAKRLFYRKLLVLSGTFMANKWYDIWGFLDLFPANPFPRFEGFVKTFGHIEGKRPSETCKVEILAGFLDSFIIARPQDVLQLKGLERHKVDVTLPDGIALTIMVLTDLFHKMAVMSKDEPGQYASGNVAAMSKYVQASLTSFCPLVARGAEVDTTTARKWLKKKGLTVSQASTEQRMSYIKRFTKKVEDGDDSDDETYQPGRSDKVDNEEYVPGLDEYSEAEELEYVKEETSACRGPVRRAWLNKLANTPTADFISAPRVSAGCQTVKEILASDPTAKIVLFSRYHRVLDVLKLSLGHVFGKQKGNALEILEYNGSMSTEERDDTRRHFQKGVGPMVLLITAGAGGQGITLTASNHVIMMEYWWTVTDELQALSRCYRQGQTKTVHVWRITATNDSIEDYVRITAARKIYQINKVRERVVRSEPGCCTIEEEFAERFFKKNDWPDFEWADGVDAIDP
ncbi:hypothetical protein K4K55_011034 [Colletotrichum sp. SAR 10_96]|nr:hypothetical protein K4K55_011034 [Colletotrichum sp. SAR 10_96]